jgi:hypothetical protein
VVDFTLLEERKGLVMCSVVMHDLKPMLVKASDLPTSLHPEDELSDAVFTRVVAYVAVACVVEGGHMLHQPHFEVMVVQALPGHFCCFAALAGDLTVLELLDLQ